MVIITIKGRTEDIRVASSINFSRYYLKIRREEREELIEITKDTFLSIEYGNYIKAILNITGEKHSCRIFIKWLNELHTELDANYRSAKWLKKCHDMTWKAFNQAVAESGIKDRELWNNAIMKGIGTATFMDRTTLIDEGMTKLQNKSQYEND